MRRILVWLAPVLFLLIVATPAQRRAAGVGAGCVADQGRDWHTATLLD